MPGVSAVERRRRRAPTLHSRQPARSTRTRPIRMAGNSNPYANIDAPAEGRGITQTRMSGDSELRLFRSEVLAARGTQWLGTVLIVPTRSHRLFTLFAVLALAG